MYAFRATSVLASNDFELVDVICCEMICDLRALQWVQSFHEA